MNDLSPACGGGSHQLCPGYYLTAHPCRCACHSRKKDAIPEGRKIWL